MPVISGNTSTSFSALAFDNPSKILSFSFANKTGGGVTVSFGVFFGSSISYILYNKAISTADSYIYNGEAVIIPANHQLFISVSGSTDYYFSIEGM